MGNENRKDVLCRFEQYLWEEEKSPATVEKYLRDARYFLGFVGEQGIDKGVTLKYKAALGDTYAVSSANSMIAAMNCFLRFIGKGDCCVKQFKVQRQAYCSEEKELTKAEYERLLAAAKAKPGKKGERLCLLLETICSTGIRVSEVVYITVEAVRRGEATVTCKGKTRIIFLPGPLRKLLRRYIKEQQIVSGPIFITNSGKPMNRSTIWREMKALCEKAGVAPGKVFPHNLRHLFARTFYRMQKDIVKLADILGHSSIDTTRIYMISSGAEHRKVMNGLKLVV